MPLRNSQSRARPQSQTPSRLPSETRHVYHERHDSIEQGILRRTNLPTAHSGTGTCNLPSALEVQGEFLRLGLPHEPLPRFPPRPRPRLEAIPHTTPTAVLLHEVREPTPQRIGRCAPGLLLLFRQVLLARSLLTRCCLAPAFKRSYCAAGLRLPRTPDRPMRLAAACMPAPKTYARAHTMEKEGLLSHSISRGRGAASDALGMRCLASRQDTNTVAASLR